MTTPFLYQVLPTYFESKGLPRSWISTVLTIGQWPEIAMLAGLPWMFERIGPKGTLSLGIAAWVVRYGSLALNPPLWLAIAGVPLHGVGIACFTVAGQVYTDSQATRIGGPAPKHFTWWSRPELAHFWVVFWPETSSRGTRGLRAGLPRPLRDRRGAASLFLERLSHERQGWGTRRCTQHRTPFERRRRARTGRAGWEPRDGAGRW